MSFENRSYANNQRNSGAAKNARPVRTLLVTVLATAILYGVAIATGATSINLGLDLRGGTSVTLQPRLQAGQEGQVTAEAIDQAVAIILENKRASISLVQRHLRIGYNRAARLLEDMERAGLVSKMSGSGNREILVPGANDR